jgi:hypothetical protein
MRNLETIEAIEAAVEADGGSVARWAWLARQPLDVQVRTLVELLQCECAARLALQNRIDVLERKLTN